SGRRRRRSVSRTCTGGSISRKSGPAASRIDGHRATPDAFRSRKNTLRANQPASATLQGSIPLTHLLNQARLIRKNWLLRYGIAVALVALVTFLRVPLGPFLGNSVPFILYFPALLVVGWLAG